MEKKTPEPIHIGNIARFIRPETPSIVRGRAASSSPTPTKAPAPVRQTTPKTASDPRIGTSSAQTAKATSTVTSSARKTSRESTCAASSCQRLIGAATKSLSILPTRCCTSEKPIAHMPVDIRFMPSRPGTRKSM